MNLAEQLDPEQLHAATAPRGPVCIIAGAGTGKTRTITHRIAHLIDGGFVNPDQVLAVTFTNRAASEMRERLARMNVPPIQARTFHAAALRQLSYFWPQFAGDTQWELVENKFPLISRAASIHNIQADTTLLRDLLGEIEWAKSCLIDPDSYPEYVVPERRDCPVAPEEFVKIYRAYEDQKIRSGRLLLDFNDLLSQTIAAIESNLGIAEEFRSQYRSFTVDEYQDVTPLQQRLLRAWLGERDDITVVGDANQTIYSFNGARPHYLLDFQAAYPHATTVRLHRDYRSTPQVVGLANAIIDRATGKAAASRLTLEGQRPNGPEPTFTEYPDEPAEAAAVATQIKQLIASGVDPAEIAILYRVNSQSATFEYALDAAGVPYQVKGGEGFFRRPEIRAGLAAINEAAAKYTPTDDEGRPLTPQPGQVANAVRAALTPVGLTPHEPSGAQEKQRWQSLQALAQLAEQITTENPTLSFLAVAGMLRERASSQNPPRVSCVTLASIHAAKGLEWDAVFLVGMTDGMVPIHYALQGVGAHNAIEEERRLLYVGVTRAREHLHLSWALARQPGGKATRAVSRFLEPFTQPPATDSQDNSATTRRKTSSPTKRRGAPKHACVVCGAPLHVPELKILQRCGEHSLEADQAVLSELREWRLQLSQQRQVPAYVILTDASLRALAQHMPSSPEELLQVPGMGQVKVAEFGQDLLAILANYT